MGGSLVFYTSYNWASRNNVLSFTLRTITLRTLVFYISFANVDIVQVVSLWTLKFSILLASYIVFVKECYRSLISQSL